MAIEIPVPKTIRTPEQMEWYLQQTGWRHFHTNDHGTFKTRWYTLEGHTPWLECQIPDTDLEDWPQRRQEIMHTLVAAGQVKLASFLDPMPKRCGARLHFEVAGTMRVRRNGTYSWRCPECRAEGTTTNGKMLTCQQYTKVGPR